MRKRDALVVVSVAAAVWASTIAMAGELTWGKDLQAATAKANAQGKLVLVDFYTTWCGWCKKLEAECYTDENIVELVEEKFVPVKVDGDKHKDIVRRYQVRGYPTTLILDGSGNVVKRIVGYREAAVFLVELKDGLELAELMKELPELEKKAAAGGAEGAEAAARIGYIYRRLGNTARARRYLEAARAGGYKSPELDLDLLLVGSKGAARINGLSRWCKANGESPRRWEAYFELGLAQANMRLWSDAVVSFDKVAAGSPDSVWGVRAAMYAKIIRERYLQPQSSDCPT